jgi:hypothetical protein
MDFGETWFGGSGAVLLGANKLNEWERMGWGLGERARRENRERKFNREWTRMDANGREWTRMDANGGETLSRRERSINVGPGARQTASIRARSRPFAVLNIMGKSLGAVSWESLLIRRREEGREVRHQKANEN